MIQLLIWLLPITLFAQEKAKTYEVKYAIFENKNKTDRTYSFIFHDQIAYLSKKDDVIKSYSDFNSEKNLSTIAFYGASYQLDILFSDLPKPEKKDTVKYILGFECKYAFYNYFSNKIEVWYTEKSPAKGSPYSRFLPSKDALVMEISVNGSRRMVADSIFELNEMPYEILKQKANIKATESEFEALKIQSRYHRLNIFDQEQIYFDPNIEIANQEELELNKTYHFSNASVILKKVKLSKEMRNCPYVFAKLNCKSNGDAYDRTGSVFILPDLSSNKVSVLDAYLKGLDQLPTYTDNEGNQYQGIVKTKDYQPPIEIMRFFTSFGAHHFNEKRAIDGYHWAEDVIYEQDVSSLIPNDTNAFWVGVFIGNYDGGGHQVGLQLEFYPSWGENEEETKYINPLFSTVNTLEMSGQNYGKLFGNDTLETTFQLEENIENLELLYTTTGHGGWGGGDEFNPKLNQVFIDGELVFKVIPWRSDCATYRLLNPASGNFENGLSSSDLSRSNWCPGTLTPPYRIPLDSIDAGIHKIQIIIDQGAPEGGNMSFWNVSGILVGNLKANK